MKEGAKVSEVSGVHLYRISVLTGLCLTEYMYVQINYFAHVKNAIKFCKCTDVLCRHTVLQETVQNCDMHKAWIQVLSLNS